MGTKNVTIEVKEKDGSISASFKKPTSRYINEFLKLKCAPDLLLMKLFPNSKEITESFATYRAFLYHFVESLPLHDSDTVLISVGDGRTPRTAATFAFRSHFECHSVDPHLKDIAKWKSIDRLYLHPICMEDFKVDLKGKNVVVVAVHSHANLQSTVNTIKSNNGRPVVVIALPCCVPQELERNQTKCSPDYVYSDWGIWSPEREFRIWNFIDKC